MSPNSLRLKIVELVYKSKEGHIPSAFSIVDIIVPNEIAKITMSPQKIKPAIDKK